MCSLDDADKTQNRVLAQTSRPIVNANGADLQSGMSLSMLNLSKFKRLAWPKFMLPVKFFHIDKNSPSISPLEKLIVAKI